MLKNYLSAIANDYKKDVAMVAVAFVGGVALGYVLSKNLNAETLENIKNQANGFVSDFNNQINENIDLNQENEILDSDEKDEILNLKKEKESFKVDIELEENDE